MGCCQSNDDSSLQPEETDAERQQLLRDVPGQHYGTQDDAFGSSPVDHSLGKSDEDSTLNRILHSTAANIIDVAQLETQVEQQDYLDRERQYRRRLRDACVTSRTLPAVCTQRLPGGVPNPVQTLSEPTASLEDIKLVKDVAYKVSKLVQEIKVKHREDLVVPLGVP